MNKIINDTSLKEHFDLYNGDKNMYINNAIEAFSNRNINKTISIINKSRIIAIILQNIDKESFDKLITFIDLPELTRACEILDSTRLIKQLKEKQKKQSKQSKMIKIFDKKIDAAEILNESCLNLSLTSSKCKLIKKWTKQLTPEQLEYRATIYKTDLWLKLADLTHLSSKNDFSLDWFLSFCFGGPVPENTFTFACNNMTYENFEQAYNKFNIPFETIRVKISLNNNVDYEKRNIIKEIKNMITAKETIYKILWYYKELQTNDTESILIKRIEEFDNVVSTNLAYGTIIDLITNIKSKKLYDKLIEIASNKMKVYNLNIDAPVAVLCDASGSMEVAIKTSGVITSLLCYLTKAELHLFRSEDENIIEPPHDVESAIRFGREIKANNSTNPSNSLYYYYSRHKAVKTFIIVTDEEENAYTNNMNFMILYIKYCKEIYPAKLIFISFSDINNDAKMIRELKDVLGSNFDELVKAFKFNKENPDTNKLDLVFKYLEGISIKGNTNINNIIN